MRRIIALSFLAGSGPALLELMRDRASRIAGVDEIVDLKLQIGALEGGGEGNQEEQERLRSLIARAREFTDSPESDARRRELQTQLEETAKATAMADRLNARRREAARETLNRQLALIREMRSLSRAELAQSVLQLRARRRGLERRLDISPNGPEDEF